MTKDRLCDLKAAQNDEDEFELLEAQINMEVADGFMEEFFVEVKELREWVEALKTDTEQVKRVHSDILSQPKTDEKTQQELDDLTASIKEKMNKVRFKLKSMELSIEQAEQHSDSPAEVRIRRTQHAAISKKFVQVMADYNTAVTEHQERCKKRIGEQLEITGVEVTEEQLETMLEEGNVAVFTQEIETDPQQAKMLLRDLKARHADLMQLETSLQELHDMFVDMAVLVESQGELIDCIETQVENAVEFVDRANADMKKAREFENKARKKKLMMLAAGFIVGSILLAVIKQKLGL